MLDHNNFITYLKAERRQLEELKRQLLKSLEGTPEGNLNILRKKGQSPDYYHYFTREHREYISKKEVDLARKLAQKAYDRQVLELVDKRLCSTDKLLKAYDPTIDQCFDRLSTARQQLLTPVNEPDQMYISNWYSAHPGYQNEMPFTRPSHTNRGEIVRSKSEKIIADLLNKYDIPYVYEPVLKLKNGKTYYPDFLTLNVRLRKTIAFEHFGIMGNAEYSQCTCDKINDYMRNGFYPGDNLMFSMESDTNPLDSRIVEALIKRYLL